MTDGLSVAANVVGVVVAALHGTRLLLDDLKDVIDAPKAISALKEDLICVDTALKSIQGVPDQEWALLGNAVAEQSKLTIKTCTDACESFHADLKRWTKHSDEKLLSWQDRVNVGFFKQKRIKAISQQLQSCKTTINSVVGIATLYSSIRRTHVTEEIKSSISRRGAEITAAISSTEAQLADMNQISGKLPLEIVGQEADEEAEDKESAIRALAEERVALQSARKLLEDLLSRMQGDAIARAVDWSQNMPNEVTIHALNVDFPTERQETPQNPSTNVPFLRDVDYVDRTTINNLLWEKCSKPAFRVALVGLGGVGKSQLAIEFSYRMRERSPDTWVFWVHASNATRFEQSFRDIADKAKIPGRRDTNVSIFELVYNWLRDEQKGKWVIILDNVDNAGFLLEQPSISHESRISGQRKRPLKEYIPPSPNGSILITSRNRSAALQLVEWKDIIDMEPMDKADAVILCRKKLDVEGKEEETSKLVEALEFMPLAIVQAAAYIKERERRCSLEHYLEKFQKSDGAKTGLLNHEAGQLRRDWEARSSIILTWRISFDHIRETRPSAAELLSLMSFFDRHGIPEFLLRNEEVQVKDSQSEGVERDVKAQSPAQLTDEDSPSESSTDDRFETDIATLRNYSFLSLTKDPQVFQMHRLVQLATQKWLNVHGEFEVWQGHFIRHIYNQAPTGDYENWTKWQKLFPHVKATLLQHPDGKDALTEVARILYYGAWYSIRMGNFSDAEKMVVRSLNISKTLFGERTREIARRMDLLADIYRATWRLTEAEKLLKQSRDLKLEFFEADDPGTLQTMEILALTHVAQGRLKEGVELLSAVLETRKRVLGADHKDTLTIMVHLTLMYNSQGKLEESERLLLQVVDTRKKTLGMDHPDTLLTANNLAETYRNQGRLREAEELQLQVGETQKKKLGADHPDTLVTFNSLAETYRNQGMLPEAEKLQLQLVETQKKKFGMDHPDTLLVMNNLALTYQSQGRFPEAEELQLQVMESQKKNLGMDHPRVLITMNNLAVTYRGQGRLKEAEELQLPLVQTQKKKLGMNHLETLVAINNLAVTIQSQGRLREAEDLQLPLVDAAKRLVGAEHPFAIKIMDNLARTYSMQDRIEDATEIRIRVLELATAKLGEAHPSTMKALHDLAWARKRRHRYDDAIALMKKYVRLKKATLDQYPFETINPSEAVIQWELESKIPRCS